MNNKNFRDFLCGSNIPSTQPGSWVNYFGNGGKVQPYITNNPNDPRIQKYKDSLNAYNFGEESYSFYNKIKKDYNLPVNKGFRDGHTMVRDSKLGIPYKGMMPTERVVDKYIKKDKSFLSSFFDNNKDDIYISAKGERLENMGAMYSRFKKPVQEVILNQNKSTVNTTKGKVSGKVVPNDAKGSKLIQVREEIKPQNTNFNVNVNGEFSTPEDYVEPVVEQMPIQETQDFRKYMQPNGYSRQGQSGERQSESFYDANGKMTGQIINGQYVPTEYGRFLESGMSEDEYLNSVQEFRSGGEFSNGGQHNDKKQYAYQYYLAKGYKPHESAAIVGNLMQESNLNDKIAKDFQGRNAFGVAQWTDKSRRQNLFSRYGDNPTFEQQLEHVDYELNTTHKGALSKLKSSKNVDEATLAISKHYEIPSEKYAHNDKRINYARSILGISPSTVGSSMSKYFSQIEQDLSWRSKEIDQELEDEEIPQYSQEEVVADNIEEEDEENTTEEQSQMIQDEYLPLEELSKLMTASRRNDFLDIVFANTAPSIEGDQYQYYG